jgi:hypothetical protein
MLNFFRLNMVCVRTNRSNSGGVFLRYIVDYDPS